MDTVDVDFDFFSSSVSFLNIIAKHNEALTRRNENSGYDSVCFESKRKKKYIETMCRLETGLSLKKFNINYHIRWAAWSRSKKKIKNKTN